MWKTIQINCRKVGRRIDNLRIWWRNVLVRGGRVAIYRCLLKRCSVCGIEKGEIVVDVERVSTPHFSVRENVMGAAFIWSGVKAGKRQCRRRICG